MWRFGKVSDMFSCSETWFAREWRAKCDVVMCPCYMGQVEDIVADVSLPWFLRIVSVKVWTANFGYFQYVLDYRWHDVQFGNMKDSYDGGHQEATEHKEYVEDVENMEDVEDVEDNAQTGVQDEMATEVRSDKDHDSGYCSMEEETHEDGNNADNDGHTSSDDEAVLTPSTKSDVGETGCCQEREWPRELEWHHGFGPCSKIDCRIQDANKAIGTFRGLKLDPHLQTDCCPM